ncbi:DUF3046 domain-containing protein [Aeromicrobium sp. 636]|uniref:DUF3046 domain-containing protein n=1 Tax=Aeromicrobium senzhongii TaxID=2663859 RepID=A0A8I0JZK3_9ACTN|nr:MULTISPECIES: DUF3046 domain-containing protein [Aeromicrobium]MBC9224798.1 DUF3046 domain-containing protein [Aeromicrobium senzhongii]MCQ3996911.1 DUF3046 domain-containing protein [Aeromicrobium sp. 636]MTB86845.1 DUF3046 domain-containing protein [Aeromicrobium senzhongii]QNL93317.1 DUF3046 domain-containing protein [Aeromicrobium senzhongii]
MRHSEFWQRMEAALGAAYASSWARQQAIGALGGRTPVEALEAGVDPQQVWRAVHATLDLPARER